ncbi:MAG: ABC transporter substrate-binding protein [Anaerolineae bacterium]|nr:ABC transporter substrate-binding protein [Anaerolineae bacterium]
MMKRIITLVAAASLAACAAPPVAQQAAPAKPAAELQIVKFGFVPVAINGPVYVAAEKGYFAEEGLKVEFLPIEGGSDAVVQVASGNFDVAGGGISASMLNAVARGIEFEIAASLHTERPPLASPFVVSKKRYESGELTKMSDLKGKKVATNNRGTATEWWLSEALRQGGVDITEVEVLGLPFPQVAPALESGPRTFASGLVRKLRFVQHKREKLRQVASFLRGQTERRFQHAFLPKVVGSEHGG